MSIRIVRLGSPRRSGEGLRLGTVRRPPRGVRKTEYARLDWFDVWFPTLAPSLPVMKLALQSQAENDVVLWRRFVAKYKAEMARPEAAHAIALLAALSHTADFSVGCYCADESRCHRSLLRGLLKEQGARLGE